QSIHFSTSSLLWSSLRLYLTVTRAWRRCRLWPPGSRPPPARLDPCLQPMKVGSCRAAFPKFYYDVVNQTCRSFTYGGCDANGNNFESREDCEATCNGVTVKSTLQCEAEPMAGPCRAAFRQWYYDSQQRQCKTFIYGGCKGNKNNYDSQQSCLDTCHGNNNTTINTTSASVLLVLVLRSVIDLARGVKWYDCLSSPDPGPCRAAFPKFYYDPATGSCQSFIYGGCGGNKNQFSSAEECQTRCSGVIKKKKKKKKAKVMYDVTMLSCATDLLASSTGWLTLGEAPGPP
uniref:BPTI/Kunitz inhibitor domain-containing protein n=1 Tax=Hippocampus comes TaxID=109280 RepID=A0A3Q2YDP0_HIPCM